MIFLLLEETKEDFSPIILLLENVNNESGVVANALSCSVLMMYGEDV